jgi:hypothetical protein
MPTKSKAPKPGTVDPAQTHNERILKERQERIDKEQLAKAPDLGSLGVHIEERPPASTAAEFIRDEFDKKNFGEPLFTTRVMYGPHPLYDIPAFRAYIDDLGLEEFSALVYQTIMLKEEMAFPDPVLKNHIRRSMKLFGKDRVAEAFRQGILSIPSKIVNVEVDTGDDDEVLGDPLGDAVRRYGHIGMSPKFQSERCIALRGDQGYQVVHKPNGDPVKVGTLVMGEIPEIVARRRQAKYAKESDDAIRDQDNAYQTAESRFAKASADIPAERMKGTGFLRSGTTLEGNASDLKDVTLGFQLEQEPRN